MPLKRRRLVGFKHSNGKYQKYYEKYRCRSCGRYWTREDFHRKVSDLFFEYEMPEEVQGRVVDALDDVWKKDREDRVQEVRTVRLTMLDIESDIERKVESATDSSNISIKEEILKIIEKKKEELANLEEKMKKLTKEDEEDKREFMEFALNFLSETGKHFLEPYVTKENRIVCKQMLFPGGIFVDLSEKVYTPKASAFYREVDKKKDAVTSQKIQLVRVPGL